MCDGNRQTYGNKVNQTAQIYPECLLMACCAFFTVKPEVVPFN